MSEAIGYRAPHNAGHRRMRPVTASLSLAPLTLPCPQVPATYPPPEAGGGGGAKRRKVGAFPPAGVP